MTIVRKLVRFSLKTIPAPLWIIAWVLWLVVLCTLSSIPSNRVHLPAFPNSDKVVHFFYFAAGGGLLAGFLLLIKWSVLRSFLFAVIAMAIVGAVDEWHQLHTPGRAGADIGDWTADVTGAFLGIVLTLFIFRNSGKPKSEN